MGDLFEKVVSLAKRRGFVYPGSEIYGGLSGIWDLGPLGVLLANNIKQEWWGSIVLSREDVVGLDSSILHHPKVWEASGHVASFTDPLAECKACHHRFRADEIQGMPAKLKKAPAESRTEIFAPPDEFPPCPNCNATGTLTDLKMFNLMFKTYIGPVEDEASMTYLRPETAQGIFINFDNVVSTMRVKVPFGTAQIGKGFRNEITTGNFLFRVREFEMMELEFFVKPGTEQKWHEYWKKERLNWFLNLGIRKDKIKVVDLPKAELAHYSRGTAEIWYDWPFMGYGELEGIASRGDYDLSQHAKYSGEDLSYHDQETGEKFVPYVVEPSVGVGRAMLAFLTDAYYEDKDRVVLRLHPKLAPYKVAVFPLLANKEDLVKKAKNVYELVRKSFVAVFDDRGNIGKRYYAQDEIGTPYCLTIDFQTLEDNTVTIRDRDTTKQERVKIENLKEMLDAKLT